MKIIKDLRGALRGGKKNETQSVERRTSEATGLRVRRTQTGKKEAVVRGRGRGGKREL